MGVPKRHAVHLVVVGAIAVAAASPVLVGMAAVAVASLSGCELDGADVHPCEVLGVESGATLLRLATSMWYAVGSVPMGVVAVAAYLAAVGLVRWVRRGRDVR